MSPATPNNSLTDPASLSAQQQQQSQSSSSASHPILDGLMSKASAERTTSNPSLNSAAANANEAPRGSRFAKMFNSNNTSASSTPPNSQGKEEASAAGFMSALLNQGSSSSQGGAPAAPLQSKPEKAQPAASSQDNDMMRIMNMLQSSVSVQQPTQVAPYDHFSQQQQQNVGPQQSRHAFARAQQAPPPRDGPSTSPRQALDLQAMLARSNGGLSPSSGHGARPPTSSASIPDGVAPHSVAGMVNMGKANGPSYAENGYPSKSPNTSLDASRLNIAENGFSAPPPRRSEPPRMQQASYEQMPQAIPPGYPLPRTQPFPTHMQQQQPRQQQQQQHQQGGRQPSLYDLQNMGMFPPGLPGAMHPAARMAMHPQAYGIQQHMMPPPPPPPHQQVSNPAQSLSMMPPAAAQYAQAGGPGRSMGGGGSPDLMALFANAGGVPAQFR